MIYALTQLGVPTGDRKAILAAIKNYDAASLQPFVDRGVIRHIMDIGSSPELHTYFCIWCQDSVNPAYQNRSPKNPSTVPWYFKHDTNDGCIGHTTLINGEEFINSEKHGCYIQLKQENESTTALPIHPRHQCNCIANGTTYCHHAANQKPACPQPNRR